MAPIAVLGATSWGVTLSWLLAGAGNGVVLICRTVEEATDVRERRGIARLDSLTLPGEVVVATDLPQDVGGIIVAAPAQSVRATILPFRRYAATPVLSAAKGLEHGTGLRMSAVLAAVGWPDSLISVLSGPNLAREIAAGLPAAAVVASLVDAQAAYWQSALSGPAFRVYRSADVTGVELAGALKNVVAIAAGACAGFGLGANALAAVMTRGLAEITRLGVSLGANPLTFQGLAGVGDLAATCMSPLSRNHRLGEMLAQGASPEEAIAAIGEAVEGAETARVALDLARSAGIGMPITEQVAAVLAGSTSARAAMTELLRRAPSSEPEHAA